MTTVLPLITEVIRTKAGDVVEAGVVVLGDEAGVVVLGGEASTRKLASCVMDRVLVGVAKAFSAWRTFTCFRRVACGLEISKTRCMTHKRADH